MSLEVQSEFFRHLTVEKEGKEYRLILPEKFSLCDSLEVLGHFSEIILKNIKDIEVERAKKISETIERKEFIESSEESSDESHISSE